MVDLTGYKLTFDDEFNSLSVSATGVGTVWSDLRPASELTAFTDGGYGDSAFVDPGSGIDPFSLQDGALDIQAIPITPTAVTGTAHWASGLLQSAGSFSQEYGYFEMRAELPAGAGTWPGLWMLAENGDWPPEIDVAETFGSNPTALSSTVHTDETGVHTFQQTWSDQPTMPTGYHTYGVLWGPDQIVFYFDGRVTGEQPTPADLHQAMYLIFGLAMTGEAGTTMTPKSLSVDYIRAYSADPSAVEVALQPISSPDGANTSNLCKHK